MLATRVLCLAMMGLAPLVEPPVPDAPQPGPPGDAAAAAMPTKTEIGKKMVASLTSSPVLHVTMSQEFQGQHYDAQAWMTKSKSRGELREDGKLIFAIAVDAGRVQEFAPWVEFKNGQNAKNVLVEYDAEGNEVSLDWPRLIPTDLACGPGAVGASWLIPSRPMVGAEPGVLSIPDTIAQVLEEPGDLKGVTLNKHDCYWMHAEISINEATRVTKDLYIDVKTFEPVRDSIVTTVHGRVTKSITTDYDIQHLRSEDGISWRLDAAKLSQREGGK
ncbi:MAG: hypothetical protein GC200_02775 [Tepidisphaera sp.]|nr:hypothetical protein [Tepidisphaera sp.]